MKITIQPQSKLASDNTAHLQPIIDFLISIGAKPATGKWSQNENRKGFDFHSKLDLNAVKAKFNFPSTIWISEEDQMIFDSNNSAFISGLLE